MTPASAQPSPQHLRALLMLLLACFFWGLSFPIVKTIALLHTQLLPEAGTWFSAIYTVAPRFVLATLILVAWQPRGFWQFTRDEVKQGVVMGFLASAGMLFQNDGLQFTEASTSAFLTQFYAILIPIWVAVRHRRNPGVLVWTCCVLVLAGVAILGRFDPFGPLRASGRAAYFGRGEWETLLCSLFFMGQILWLEKKEFAANRPEKLTLVMFALQAVVFCALALATAPTPRAVLVPWTSPVWLGFTVVLTLLCTIGAYSIMNAWQPKITATEAGLIYCMEPIFGSVMACFLPALFSTWAAIDYPNEVATWTLLVGGGLVTLANVLLHLKPPARA